MFVKLQGVKVIKVEPYWNVNLSIRVSACSLVRIKVEPYWNVNFNISFINP